jgi:hypothetical protein
VNSGWKNERGEGVGEIEIRNTKLEMRKPTRKTHPAKTKLAKMGRPRRRKTKSKSSRRVKWPPPGLKVGNSSCPSQPIKCGLTALSCLHLGWSFYDQRPAALNCAHCAFFVEVKCAPWRPVPRKIYSVHWRELVSITLCLGLSLWA